MPTISIISIGLGSMIGLILLTLNHNRNIKREKIAIKELNERNKDRRKTYKKTFEAFPREKITQLIKKVKTLIECDDYKNAEQILISILSYDKSNLESLSILGSIYLRQKKLTRAEMIYREISDIEKHGNASTESNIAYCLFKQNKIEESVHYYKESVKLDPQNTKRHTNLAQIYVLTHQHEKAIKLFKEATKIMPRNIKLLFLLADAYAASKDKEKAIEYYKEILVLSPYNTTARDELQKLSNKKIETKKSK